jgi:hypothetical protein
VLLLGFDRGGFIGSGGRGQGRPEARRCGGPGDVHGRHRPRRPCSRAGGVWSQPRSAVGRCWRGLAGRRRAGSRGRRDGGPGRVLLLLLHFSRLGSGQRGLGSTAASSTSMATGMRRTGAVIFTVIMIFPIFVCQVFDEMPARNLNSKF